MGVVQNVSGPNNQAIVLDAGVVEAANFVVPEQLDHLVRQGCCFGQPLTVKGGLVESELRIAATRYGEWEFWPGPLDDLGNPPADCAPYDRLWEVTRDDLTAFNATGVASENLQAWPWQLGAPVIDGDGDPDLVVGEAKGKLVHFRNDGTPREAKWTEVTREFAGYDGKRNPSPVIADLDGDGVADLVVGIEDGTVRFYQGAEGGDGLQFTLRPKLLAAIKVGRNAAPSVADLNNDGKVSGRDVSIVARAPTTQNPTGDLNNDGVVDLGDLFLVLRSLIDPSCR